MSQGYARPLDGQVRLLTKVARMYHERGVRQADIATALNIKQPSVSKIEKQADMYLSTLRGYVEAIGGKLELTVKLPARPAFTIHHLGDVAAPAGKPTVARRKAVGLR